MRIIRRYAPAMARLTDQLKTVNARVAKLESNLSYSEAREEMASDELIKAKTVISNQKQKILDLQAQQEKLMTIIEKIPESVWEEIKTKKTIKKKKDKTK